jgi:hypothetical protein
VSPKNRQSTNAEISLRPQSRTIERKTNLRFFSVSVVKGRHGSRKSSAQYGGQVRARICEEMGFLGIELEEKRNAANEGVISSAAFSKSRMSELVSDIPSNPDWKLTIRAQ